VDVAGLELLDGVGNAVLLGLTGVLAEGGGASDHVAHGIGLEDDGKLEIRGGLELLSERLDVLVAIPLEAILVQAQLTGRVAGAAVTVGDVVQNETDNGVLALLLGGTGVGNGLVDVGEEGNVRDPNEGADLLLNELHLVGTGLVSSGHQGQASLLERLAVIRVDEQAAARERVARLPRLKPRKSRGRGEEAGEESKGTHLDSC
jgi:hypothetical protein